METHTPKRLQKTRRRRRRLFPIACKVLLILAVGLLLRSCTAEDEVDEFIFEVDWIAPTVPQIVIALDSGHSYQSGGAQGIVNEEDITAMTTQLLYQLLEEDDAYSPVLTHDYDTPATIAQRLEAVADLDVALLLSIHCNSNEDSDEIAGFEVYPQLTDNPNFADSYAFAQSIADGFVAENHTPRKETGIFYMIYTDDTFYTMTEAELEIYDIEGDTLGILGGDWPSVLVEQGYVTNQRDVDDWMTEAGCAQAAQVYYQAICNLFGTEPLH